MKHMITAGIDIGSTTSEALLLTISEVGKYTILSNSLIRTGFNHAETADEVIHKALEKTDIKLSEINAVVGTGYGRDNISFANMLISEIACHGKGAHFYFPKASVVVDIGGQDSKVICLDKTGNVSDFNMNDKCAAGTGRFLEVMANLLQVPLSEMGNLSMLKQKDISISSMCTVFAESEVISRISQGQAREDIINGLHMSVADRIAPMVRRFGQVHEIVMSGGVAQNRGVVNCLKNKLCANILLPSEPQFIGALGAAIFGFEK